MKRIAATLAIVLLFLGVAHAFEANMYIFAVSESGVRVEKAFQPS